MRRSRWTHYVAGHDVRVQLGRHGKPVVFEEDANGHVRKVREHELPYRLRHRLSGMMHRRPKAPENNFENFSQNTGQ